MRFSEDLTQSEIAERVGVSQMHVSRLIRRSLARLEEAAGEPEPEPAWVATSLSRYGAGAGEAGAPRRCARHAGGVG